MDNKKLNIAEIRKQLVKHNFLSDKTIDPNHISSGKKYSFTCNKGHTFESLPCNVYQSGEFHCPICSGRKVVQGINDLFTTHPQLAKHLKNAKDGYTHSFGSNKKLSWVCPDCGNEFLLSPNKLISKKSFCSMCSTSDKSYAEKFMFSLLSQLNILFESEKTFDWSNNKRYDFSFQFKIVLLNCMENNTIQLVIFHTFMVEKHILKNNTMMKKKK